MKYNLKELFWFLIIGFFAGIIGNFVTPWVPGFGNPALTSAIVYIIPLAIFYLIWKNWGQKQSS